MNWKECAVLKKTANEITKRGGVPGKMLLAEDGPVRLAVIVSHDPSGPCRRKELHASVLASSYGTRRIPTADEVKAVAEHLSLEQWENSQSSDGCVSHIWSQI